jgi:hypothetical protein
MAARYSPPNVGINMFYSQPPMTPEKTLLHHLVEVDAPQSVVDHVINAGADINARDSVFGYTPTLVAAKRGNLRLLKSLLAMGANAVACLTDGYDAFLISAKEGKKDVFHFLLESVRCLPSHLHKTIPDSQTEHVILSFITGLSN